MFFSLARRFARLFDFQKNHLVKKDQQFLSFKDPHMHTGRHETVYIQKMTLRDIPHVHELNMLFVPENYTLSYLIKHVLEHRYNYVLKKDDMIIGYVIIKVENKHAHVVSICVDSAYRQKSYGTELLSAAIVEIVNDLEAVDVTLNVRVSNVPAIRFYRKFGFFVDDLARKYYCDGEDSYIMRLRVSLGE